MGEWIGYFDFGYVSEGYLQIGFSIFFFFCFFFKQLFFDIKFAVYISWRANFFVYSRDWIAV